MIRIRMVHSRCACEKRAAISCRDRPQERSRKTLQNKGLVELGKPLFPKRFERGQIFAQKLLVTVSNGEIAMTADCLTDHGEAFPRKMLLQGSEVFRQDLDNHAACRFAEKSNGRGQTAESGQIDFHTGFFGECHFRNCGDEAAFGNIVRGEDEAGATGLVEFPIGLQIFRAVGLRHKRAVDAMLTSEHRAAHFILGLT